MDYPSYFAYFCLLTVATLCIVAGSFSSLRTPKSVKEKLRASSKKGVDEKDDDEEESATLTSSEAWLFPVVGSGALLSMYLVLKYLGPEWINFLLGSYATIMGFGAVWRSLSSAGRILITADGWQSFSQYRVSKADHVDDILAVASRIISSMMLIPTSVICLIYASSAEKPWYLTNIISLSLGHNALSLMKLDSFRTGLILLAGLFFYDIWWVFGTEVMVTVAKGLDIPIKVLWPKTHIFDPSPPLSLLGLGDIVIPGIFIALALNYDLSLTSEPPLPPYTPSSPFRKLYFYSTLTAYILGLTLTVIMMEVFRSAQPALLYLSPACSLAFLTTAVTRGQLTHAWSWAAEEVADEKDKEKSVDDVDQKTESSPIPEGDQDSQVQSTENDSVEVTS